ncbi:Urotensin-2 [Fukomys damarensis]|uniref:Urotensin-2 n=1 Tax=Fukomys damarensis TaxID=885580 RepID=A0A091E6A8_FUKDA|nr:Urotensin-2 [Fukomys damarensis]
MHKLAACFLLFVGLLHPLCCLPVSGSREAPLQLPAPDEEARLALEEMERASLLRLLREALGAESSARLRQAGTGVLARAPLHFIATEFAPRPQLVDEANPMLEDKGELHGRGNASASTPLSGPSSPLLANTFSLNATYQLRGGTVLSAGSSECKVNPGFPLGKTLSDH